MSLYDNYLKIINKYYNGKIFYPTKVKGAGVSRDDIYSLQQGKDIGSSKLHKIASALNVSMDRLYTGRDCEGSSSELKEKIIALESKNLAFENEVYNLKKNLQKIGDTFLSSLSKAYSSLDNIIAGNKKDEEKDEEKDNKKNEKTENDPTSDWQCPPEEMRFESEYQLVVACG